MKVSAIIVTRGDVDLDPVLESLPVGWEVLVWDNGSYFEEQAECYLITHPNEIAHTYEVNDLSVYGRYAAIEHATGDLIYVADDDVIVSDPQAIVDAWLVSAPLRTNHLVANMPAEFRHDGYTDSCLVGFGACFHRAAPARAFDRFWKRGGTLEEQIAVHMQMPLVGSDLDPAPSSKPMIGPPPVFFQRTCDVVFTCLTPRVLVDVPKVNREFAEDESRMYRQPGYVEERARMLELARKVRDS